MSLVLPQNAQMFVKLRQKNRQPQAQCRQTPGRGRLGQLEAEADGSVKEFVGEEV